MGVAAELADDAGGGEDREIGGHDRDRAPEIAEGRGGHELILELDEGGKAAAHGVREQFGGGYGPRLGFEFVVLLAAHLLAPRLT